MLTCPHALFIRLVTCEPQTTQVSKRNYIAQRVNLKDRIALYTCV